MGRSLLLAATVYALGHPGLANWRPPMLDPALQGFHREVNQAVADGRRALILLDDARAMRYLAVRFPNID
jgi:hypothetical protein